MTNKGRATPWNRPGVTPVAACTSSCPVSSPFLQQFSHTASGQHLLPHPFFSCLRCNPQLGPRPPHFFYLSRSHTIRHTHTHTHTSGRTPLNDQSARRICRYLRNKQQTQETNIHALSGIRTPRSQQSREIRPTPSPQATGISSFTLQMVTPVAQLAPHFK
jgi:hypothetical protein